MLTLWFAARIRAAAFSFQESRRSDVRDPERSSRLCGSGPSTSDLRDLPKNCLNLHETLPQCTVPRQLRSSRRGHERASADSPQLPVAGPSRLIVAFSADAGRGDQAPRESVQRRSP